ncbi:MAG: type II toxin-antitoxin system VapC family toxin [Saprospiraceae bacterium]|nr:type II toxin-antitoxin system VapC family toxin [Saprospiraceae bacterium]
MRLLLDSHAMIWYLQGDPTLSSTARQAIVDTRNHKFISAASIWEVAIKVSIGKIQLKFPFADFHQLLAINQFDWLPISFEHAARVSRLPFHHRDPFDRIIIAQALEERMTIVGLDPEFPAYGVPVLW